MRLSRMNLVQVFPQEAQEMLFRAVPPSDGV